MYTALYRAERPETFEQVIGQEHIVRVLRNQVVTDTVSHAYLFCGTRGTGKTTVARILAKAVNCTDEDVHGRPCGKCASCQAIKNGTFVDVYEMDAASNRGIDDARDLRDSTGYAPAAGRKKVYIIDEAHMLTQAAFNALLKTLEEPPADVIMILATTDPQKLPQTILSRCQRLDFRRMNHQLLMEHMKGICEKRGINITEGALGVLAANADGSVRDGLSLLEQCLATGEKEITRELALEYLGVASQDFFIDLVNKIINNKVGEALLGINQLIDSGKDTKQLTKDILAHYRNLMLVKYIENPENMLNLSSENVEALRKQSSYMEMGNINQAIMTLAQAINDGRYSTQPRILLELAIVKLSTMDSHFVNEPIKFDAEQKARAVTEAKSAIQTPASAPKPIVEEAAQEKNVVQNKEDRVILWNRICDRAGQVRKSVGTLRKKADLVEVGENTFTLKADTGATKRRLEEAEQILSEAATMIVGRPLRMKCHINEAPDEDEGDKAMMEALSKMFGDTLKVK